MSASTKMVSLIIQLTHRTSAFSIVRHFGRFTDDRCAGRQRIEKVSKVH